ncbi:kinase-like domain-containing protein [Mycena crocata]|nr:kinase-like domain-containing protein [Mycena crocata]
MSLPDFTGRLVDEGRLHLTEVLGAGTYGIVYKALDTTSPSHAPAHYAVKCLGPLAPNSTQGSHHDEREIKLHSHCSAHRNVISLHDRFTFDGHLFIILELSAGGHLFDAIDNGAFRQNDEHVRDVFIQLIDTVRYCHERGVYHRDLKPENILCSTDAGDIRIADFGLATDCILLSSSAGGSLSYMSPESLTLGSESESYDPRQSDVWALRSTPTPASTHFLTDGDYLRRTFPISDPLNDLLERCFRPVPTTRPTLLQLRTEIAAMDTFSSTSNFSPPDDVLAPLRPVSSSAPPTPSASFNFSAVLTAPSSASFDSSTLRPALIGGKYNASLLSPGHASHHGSARAPPPLAADCPDISIVRVCANSLCTPVPPAPKKPSRSALRRLCHRIKKTRLGSFMGEIVCGKFCLQLTKI